MRLGMFLDRLDSVRGAVHFVIQLAWGYSHYHCCCVSKATAECLHELPSIAFPWVLHLYRGEPWCRSLVFLALELAEPAVSGIESDEGYSRSIGVRIWALRIPYRYRGGVPYRRLYLGKKWRTLRR